MLVKLNPFANGSIVRSAPQLPVFDDFFHQPHPSRWEQSTGALATDVYETQNELVLKMDLPGFDPKSLNIQIEADVLTVQAQRPRQPLENGHWLWQERALEQVARSFVLPSTVDAAKCEASCEHGVLTLTLPKRDEAKPHSITVKVHS